MLLPSKPKHIVKIQKETLMLFYFQDIATLNIALVLILYTHKKKIEIETSGLNANIYIYIYLIIILLFLKIPNFYFVSANSTHSNDSKNKSCQKA